MITQGGYAGSKAILRSNNMRLLGEEDDEGGDN